MRRPKILIYSLVFIVLSAGIVRAGQMALTTYYPAPQGFYNQVFAQTNVGIGTIAPAYMVQVNTNDSATSGTTHNDGVNINSSDSHFLQIAPSLSTAAVGTGTNGIVESGDTGIIYSNGTPAGGNFVIAPWSPLATTGIRMDNNGNVGIGSTNPNAQLVVAASGTKYILMGPEKGCGALYSAIGVNGGSFASGAGCTNYSLMGDGTNLYLNTPTNGSGNIYFRSGNVTQMNLDSGGTLNVNAGSVLSGGITLTGTNNPSLMLKSNGGTYGTLGVATSAGSYSGLAATGDIVLRSTNNTLFSTNNGVSTPLVLSSTGNVGLGIASPSSQLEVQGANPIMTMYNTSTGFEGMILTSSAWQADIGTNQAAGYWYDFTNDGGNNHQLYFNGANTSWIVPPNIKVGIGNVAPTHALDVAGVIFASGGNVGPSDERFKQNIMPLTGVLPKLDVIKGVSYQWNHLATTIGLKEGEKSMGVIAQDLQKIYPELVSPIKSGGKDYLAVDYGKFTAVLLQSIKELKVQVDSQEDKIDTLQQEVKSLEKHK